MQIRFLKPELEALHTAVHEAFAMADSEVGLPMFSYALSYAQPGGDHFPDEGLYLDVLLPYLAQHAPPPASLLDVGAGTGRLSVPLARAGYEVTLLEPAASGLRVAHQKAQTAGVAARMSYACGYARDATAFGENAFDVVLAMQSLVYEDDLGETLASLLRVSRKVFCFDAFSRYGFLVGRMPTGYAYTAGYTPTTILYALDEHRTPGEKTFDSPDTLPLYTSNEIAHLARDAGLLVDEVRPVSSQEVFAWEKGDPLATTELERSMGEDRVLRELGACHLVLARKPEAK